MAVKKDRDPIVGGTPLSKWRQRLTSADHEERLRAVNDLRKMEKRALKAVPLLVDALKDDIRHVQACALRALARLDVECPETVGPDAEVALTVLQELLKDSNEEVRFDAARILGSIGPAAAAAAPQMGKLLARSSEVGASWVADFLARLGPDAVPHLTTALRSRKIHVRSFAAFGLGKLGPAAAGAVPDLVKALSDKAPARTYATLALGEIASNGKLAVPALIKALSDEEHETRRAAVTSLGQFGPSP